MQSISNCWGRKNNKQQLAFRPFIRTNSCLRLQHSSILAVASTKGSVLTGLEQLWDFLHQEATVGTDRCNYFNMLFFT